MPNTDGRIWERLAVLREAANLHRRSYRPDAQSDSTVAATAELLWQWVISPTRIRVTYGPVTDKTTGAVISPTLEGPRMQLTNTQKVTVTVDVVDRGGENLPDDPATTDDNPVFSVDDPAVLESQISDDGRECSLVTRSTGTAVFTVTLGDKIFTEAFDVLHSEADRLNVTFGEPQEKDGRE
jgi:hypothetical protein